jgi:hypothetical protein
MATGPPDSLSRCHNKTTRPTGSLFKQNEAKKYTSHLQKLIDSLITLLANKNTTANKCSEPLKSENNSFTWGIKRWNDIISSEFNDARWTLSRVQTDTANDAASISIRNVGTLFLPSVASAHNVAEPIICGRVLKNLTFARLEKQFHAFYGNRMIFRTHKPGTCPYTEPDESSPCLYVILLRSILIISFHLCLGLIMIAFRLYRCRQFVHHLKSFVTLDTEMMEVTPFWFISDIIGIEAVHTYGVIVRNIFATLCADVTFYVVKDLWKCASTARTKRKTKYRTVQNNMTTRNKHLSFMRDFKFSRRRVWCSEFLLGCTAV